MTEYNAYQLADMADVTSPDSPESPGAQWLEQVASYADELNPDGTLSADEVSDDIHQVADDCVPIYTHERWRVFVDLCAYNEDLSEFGVSRDDDMTKLAGIALYLIAERLLTALVEAKSEEDGES